MRKLKSIKWAIGLSSALSVLIMPAAAQALIHTSDIADGAVTGAKIARRTIGTSDIKLGAIGGGEIARRTIGTTNLNYGSVGTLEIADGAVTGADISSAADITANSVSLGNGSAHNGALTTDVTWGTGNSDSSQPVAADLTLEGVRGAGTFFEAPIMGHLHGNTLTGGTNGVYHAGVVGAYSVATSDAATGPKAGLVGVIGVDGDASSAADAAVMAVIDGGDPGAVITGDAAYGVKYLNADAGAKFTYGLDLFGAAAAPYPAVSFATADIRLQNGETISNGTDGQISFGSAKLVTTGLVDFSGATGLLAPAHSATLVNGADASATCNSANKGDIRIDAANLFYGCDGANWSKLSN